MTRVQNIINEWRNIRRCACSCNPQISIPFLLALIQKESSWMNRRGGLWQGVGDCADNPCGCACDCWKRYKYYNLESEEDMRLMLSYACYNAGYGSTTVARYQEKLNEMLDPSPELVTDGDIGTITRTAIERFQRENGLPVNGRLNEATKLKINEMWTRKNLGKPDPYHKVPSTPQRINDEVVGTTKLACLKVLFMTKYLMMNIDLPGCSDDNASLTNEQAQEIADLLAKADQKFNENFENCRGVTTAMIDGRPVINWNDFEDCVETWVYNRL